MSGLEIEKRHFIDRLNVEASQAKRKETKLQTLGDIKSIITNYRSHNC